MDAKKQWTGKEKLAIVLQWLKGDCSVSHGITQGMYYKWRNQLLSDGAKLFERGRSGPCASALGTRKPQAQRNHRQTDHRVKKTIDEAV